MRPRSFAASSLLALGACGAPTEGAVHDTAAPLVEACGAPAAVSSDLGCEDDRWAGFVWAEGGCLDDVVVNAWAPLHHERHELERVDAHEGSEAWSLGPLLTGVSDWSSAVSSRWTCQAHAALTFALVVVDATGRASCQAWGPRAGQVAALPGSRAWHEGCAIR